MTELQVLSLAENDMLFCILTETWLRDHLDAEVNVANYTIFRSDRERERARRGRNSGGVAIYVKSDIAASTEILLKKSIGVIETLCVYIKRVNLVICAIYRSPDDPNARNRSTHVEFNTALSCLSETLSSLPTPSPDIIFGGGLQPT